MKTFCLALLIMLGADPIILIQPRLTAVNDSYHAGYLYLQARRMDRDPAFPNHDELSVSAYDVCNDILSSGYFDSLGIDPIDMNNLDDSAPPNYLEAWRRAREIQIIPSFPSFERTALLDGPYMHGRLTFEGFNENAYIAGSPITDYVILCLGKKRYSGDPVAYHITKEYNLLAELSNDTIEYVQTYTFDFFNYAGIHRPVHLYTTPKLYIDDITVKTTIASDGTTGLVHYSVSVKGPVPRCSKISIQTQLIDRKGNTVAQQKRNVDVDGQVTNTLSVSNAKLWWPYLMHRNPAYLYTLKVEGIVYVSRNKSQSENLDVECESLHSESQTGEVTLSDKEWSKDVYELKIGIRELKWNSTTFILNGKPVYFRGFSRHEDSDLRGKGLDLVTTTRDYNLLTWIGANAYRTSHYPYAEEIMDKADELGFLIMDECPAVNVENYTDMLLERHIDSLCELIGRDKNRASVVMWSVANEPRSNQPGTAEYFKAVTDSVRELDTTRPQVAALFELYNEDLAGEYLDIIGFNRYYSWYQFTGRLEVIYEYVVEEARAWHEKYNKPVIMTEFGADTMPGLHKDPSVLWTEEYLMEVLSNHFQAFDTLRKENFFIGELIWNFADFNTAQNINRVDGNKKGVFTRQRQPKAAAHLVRQRYWSLGLEFDNVTLPKDLFYYVSEGYPTALRCTNNH